MFTKYSQAIEVNSVACLLFGAPWEPPQGIIALGVKAVSFHVAELERVNVRGFFGRMRKLSYEWLGFEES